MNRINHRGTTREDGGANESQQSFKPLKVAKSDFREIYSKLTTPKNVLGSHANTEQIRSVQNNISRERNFLCLKKKLDSLTLWFNKNMAKLSSDIFKNMTLMMMRLGNADVSVE